MNPHHDELKRYKTILDTLPDMVSLFDANLECIYVNQTLIDNTEISRDGYLGVSIETILEPLSDDQAQEWIKTMKRLASAAQSQARDTMTIETNAGDIHIETTASRIESETGDLIGIVNVTRDITERVEAQRALHRQNEQLEEFASVVSHDLRNPLTVAQGRLDLAQEACETEHHDAIATALNRMERIIEDLLWLARESQNIGSTEAVALDDAIDAAWDIVSEQAADADLRYGSDDHQLPTIEADYDRLCQLLENLFRNAIEHGGDDVVITVDRLDDGFAVEDDGPGIPGEEREDVFAPGYSTADDGTGFGLNIVKQVVDGHDWKIQITDGSDGGARFEITRVKVVAE